MRVYICVCLHTSRTGASGIHMRGMRPIRQPYCCAPNLDDTPYLGEDDL